MNQMCGLTKMGNEGGGGAIVIRVCIAYRKSANELIYGKAMGSYRLLWGGEGWDNFSKWTLTGLLSHKLGPLDTIHSLFK